MNKLRDSGIYEKLVRDSGSRPPLPDPVIIGRAYNRDFTVYGRAPARVGPVFKIVSVITGARHLARLVKKDMCDTLPSVRRKIKNKERDAPVN